MCFAAKVVGAAVVVLLLSARAGADGGVVRLRQTVSSIGVTLFSAEPLRVGAADLSVLVQEEEQGEVVLDGEVEIILWPPGEGTPRRFAARREAATNKLLRAAVVDLDEAGAWRVAVVVRRGGEVVEVRGEIPVAEALPRVAGMWDVIALPGVVVVLFLASRWLVARRAAGGTTATR